MPSWGGAAWRCKAWGETDGGHRMTMAFCSDYDGTLRKGTIRPSAANLAAVRRFQERGGLFGLNTGRTRSRLFASVGNLLQPDFTIVMSGALVLDGAGEVIWERRMPHDVMEAIVGLCRRNMLGLYLVAGDEYWTASPLNHLRKGHAGFNFVSSLQDIPDPVYGLAFRALTPRLAGVFARRVNEEFAGAACAYQNAGSVDIVPVGCSKATGLEVVRREFGLATVAAMGDSYNDVPMFGAADVSYTFPDSPKDVRAAADVVLPSVAEAIDDFVARVEAR